MPKPTGRLVDAAETRASESFISDAALPAASAAARLLILSGCRPGPIMTLRREQVDRDGQGDRIGWRAEPDEEGVVPAGARR